MADTTNKEVIVVEWLAGQRPVPAWAQTIVAEYQRMDNAIMGCTSYPRHIEQRMNVIYDALVATVSGS